MLAVAHTMLAVSRLVLMHGLPPFRVGGRAVIPPFRVGGRAVIVAAIARKTIAYSDGQDVRFASAANLQTVGRVCRGGWGTSGGGDGGGGGGGSGGDKAAVTALAFDAVSPEILYVGAETGEVMVSSP